MPRKTATTPSTKRGQNEGSAVRLHKTGLYYTHVSFGSKANGKRDRRTVYGKTKEEVRAKADELRTNHRQGKVAPTDPVTLGSWLDKWLALKRPHLADGTFRDYQSVLTNVPEKLCRTRLQKVTRADLKQLESDLTANKTSVRTRGKVFQYLRAAFDEALEQGIHKGTNPAYNIHPKATQSEQQGRKTGTDKALDDATMWKFLDAARGELFYGLFYTMFALGLRRGEALGLRWRDVNLETGEVKIVQQVKRGWDEDGSVIAEVGSVKTLNAKRTLYATPELLEVLKERRAIQNEHRDILGDAWTDTGLVFTSSQGEVLHPDSVNKAIQRICVRAGIKTFSSHDPRHTALSRLRREGVALEVVSEIAGHSKASTTSDLYVHPTDEEKRRALAGTMRRPARPRAEA